MSGLLSKQRLLELLGRLNEKLAAAEERGEIYIVGGAMMVLAHGAERRTRDIEPAAGRREGGAAGVGGRPRGGGAADPHGPETAVERGVQRRTEPMRDETARRKLEQLEREMRHARLRGHIYFTKTTAICFATTTATADEEGQRNVGPEPVLKAIAELTAERQSPEAWLEELRGEDREREPAPMETAWNTPYLVVTGVQPRLALCAALEHGTRYPAAHLAELAAEAGITNTADADRLFSRVHGRPLPEHHGLNRIAATDGRALR